MRKPLSILSVFAATAIAVVSAISCCAKTFLDDDSPHYDVQWNQLIDRSRYGTDDKALPLLESALRITKHFASPDIREAATARVMAKILSRQGQHARAVELLKRSVQICRSLNTDSNTYGTTAAFDLASEYTQVNNFDQAKSILETALPSVTRIEGKDSLDFGKMNEALGRVYFQRKNYAPAEKCFVQAARSFRQVNGGEGEIADVLNLAGIASMYRPMKTNDEKYLLDLIKLNRDLHFPDNGPEFVRLGSFYFKTGQAAKAKRALLTAMKLFADKGGVCGGSHGESCGSIETLDERLADLFKPESYFDMNFEVVDPADEKLARKILGELRHPAKCRP